MLAKSVTVTL